MKMPIDVSLLPQENIIKAPKQHIEDILKKLSITRQIVCGNLQENQDKRKKNMTRQPVNLHPPARLSWKDSKMSFRMGVGTANC
jgi:hypothetical protein